MDFKLVEMEDKDIPTFKKEIQEAFQKGFEEVYGSTEVIILPEADIDQSLNTKGAIAYKALLDNKLVGGAVVVINEKTQQNDLHLIYVKHGNQKKEIGKLMWVEIEKLHPKTEVWETCTPYFEKRNIHFYANKCKFNIVEYLRQIE